jgi:hypothetical protein
MATQSSPSNLAQEAAVAQRAPVDAADTVADVAEEVEAATIFWTFIKPYI